MADDRDHINLIEPYETSNWAKTLGTTEAKAQGKAVARDGPMVAAVKKYFGKMMGRKKSP